MGSERSKVEKSSPVNITFHGGRKDCPHSPGEEAVNTFPGPTMNRAEMMELMLDDFGMDENAVNRI